MSGRLVISGTTALVPLLVIMPVPLPTESKTAIADIHREHRRTIDGTLAAETAPPPVMLNVPLPWPPT